MGWAGEVQKQKILPREHQMKKIHAMAQENHTRNLITKNSCGSKIPQPPPPPPPPPLTFLMVRPMTRDVELAIKTSVWRED